MSNTDFSREPLQVLGCSSKQSVQLSACFGISEMSLFCCSVKPKKYTPSVIVYAGHPLIVLGFRDALKSACVVFWFFLISCIFKMRCYAQIFPSVVKPISVNVVNEKSIRSVNDKPMHSDGPVFNIRSIFPRHGIIWFAALLHNAPVKFINKGNIIRINYGFISLAKKNVGNIAFNADWSYGFRHLARLHLAGVGGLSVDALPAVIIPDLQSKGKP